MSFVKQRKKVEFHWRFFIDFKLLCRQFRGCLKLRNFWSSCHWKWRVGQEDVPRTMLCEVIFFARLLFGWWWFIGLHFNVCEIFSRWGEFEVRIQLILTFVFLKVLPTVLTVLKGKLLTSVTSFKISKVPFRKAKVQGMRIILLSHHLFLIRLSLFYRKNILRDHLQSKIKKTNRSKLLYFRPATLR